MCQLKPFGYKGLECHFLKRNEKIVRGSEVFRLRLGLGYKWFQDHMTSSGLLSLPNSNLS